MADPGPARRSKRSRGAASSPARRSKRSRGAESSSALRPPSDIAGGVFADLALDAAEASQPPTPGRNRETAQPAQEVVQHTSGPWSYIKDGADEGEVVERLKQEARVYADRRDVVDHTHMREEVMRALACYTWGGAAQTRAVKLSTRILT